MRSEFLTLIVAWALLIAGPAHVVAIPPSPFELPPPDPAAAWSEIAHLVQTRFHDPSCNGLDWRAVTEETAEAIRLAPDDGVAAIRSALARLNDGHTSYLTPADRAYYELLDVFHPDGIGEHPFLPAGERVHYVGVGIVATEIQGRIFAADVYPGGPAAGAGVRTGDELVSIAGGPWGDITPFLGRAGQPVALVIRRHEDGPRRALTVTPRRIQPRVLFLEAIERDARVLEVGDRTLAYVRARSHAHPSYTERVEEILLQRFAAADGLVFDMRGGWGGGSLGYLRIFNPAYPELTQLPRDGAPVTFVVGWSKPIAAIVDGGSRSSKELLAHALQKQPNATLVGTTTAGAVTAGSPFVLADGSLLYLGVADVRVNGVRLEGRGVDPDVQVERALPFAAGADAQLERAIEVLLERLAVDDR